MWAFDLLQVSLVTLAVLVCLHVAGLAVIRHFYGPVRTTPPPGFRLVHVLEGQTGDGVRASEVPSGNAGRSGAAPEQQLPAPPAPGPSPDRPEPGGPQPAEGGAGPTTAPSLPPPIDPRK